LFNNNKKIQYFKEKEKLTHKKKGSRLRNDRINETRNNKSRKISRWRLKKDEQKNPKHKGEWTRIASIITHEINLEGETHKKRKHN
jgi:hypothetical protein